MDLKEKRQKQVAVRLCHGAERGYESRHQGDKGRR